MRIANPELIATRGAKHANTKPFDKAFGAIYTALMLALPLVAGLDAVRFGWSRLGSQTLYAGAALFILGTIPTLGSVAVNRYLETTVRIQEERGRQVVTSGPYRFVRHPMYVGLILQFIALPLVLGSKWAFVPAGGIARRFLFWCGGSGKCRRRAFAVCWTLVMAVRLQFEGIRCFAEPQDAVIRPITLLVGENSSGKTTFLALCRIAYAIANGMRTAPLFNEYPFWLGAYDQIATHRGGRRGSAESFSVTIRLGDGAGLSSLHYEYASQGGQPVESIWRLESVGLVIQHASHDGRQPSLVIRGPQDKAPRPLAPVLGGATEGPPALWFSLTMGEFDRALGAGVLSQSERDSIGRALKSIQQEFRRLPYAKIGR